MALDDADVPNRRMPERQTADGPSFCGPGQTRVLVVEAEAPKQYTFAPMPSTSVANVYIMVTGPMKVSPPCSDCVVPVLKVVELLLGVDTCLPCIITPSVSQYVSCHLASSG
jgi:hypothetical protein